MKNPHFTATLLLPTKGKQHWSELMYGEAAVPDKIDHGSPIVQAGAAFADGIQVVGGVLKSEAPDEYNIKFMWVFDKHGHQYSGWPIDTSDHEDFQHEEYDFVIDDQHYQLTVQEQ